MKKRLLGGTALMGTAAIIGGMAGAAEAPGWKLSGNINFQFYWADQDSNFYTWQVVATSGGVVTDIPDSIVVRTTETVTWTNIPKRQHDWYFGVDEAELALNVDGTADNGLKYGFKIEINVNTNDGTVADEARIQLSGGWGSLQLGDEDGAEDIMNYGGENLMGATGGFDGDQDDYVVRVNDFSVNYEYGSSFRAVYFWGTDPTTKAEMIAAPSYPTIAGDTGDGTKISYYTPRFSGFQVGASITPTPNNGDEFKQDGDWENHYGIGANYDQSFGNLRIRASAVYSSASSNLTYIQDISAYSLGGIVGWGAFSLGANYTDNGDSGAVTSWGGSDFTMDKSYWNVAGKFETGPLGFAVGYFVGTAEVNFLDEPGFTAAVGEMEYEHIAFTVDYSVAPGLGVFAEVNIIDDTYGRVSSSTTSFIMGASVGF